jgi:hypothetical protein
MGGGLKIGTTILLLNGATSHGVAHQMFTFSSLFLLFFGLHANLYYDIRIVDLIF